MPNTLSRALVAFAICATLVLTGQETRALAAGTTGTLSGTVTDAGGHPLQGVAVSAVAPSLASRTTTGSNGFYALTGLSPDTYLLTFSKEGFQSQQVSGVTIVQGQSLTVSLALSSKATVLGTVTVRGAVSLVQPKTTADTYTVNAQSIQNVTGTPQNISETAILDSLPGITTDNAGYPIIRGSAENEEGYELEGIDATDPITGQFINSLSLAGVSRLVLSTGGYDVSAGNTNAGVVNEVVKRGAYPGTGQATAQLNSPNFDHRFAFEYGNATPDNRFSYFFAYNGLRQFRTYGDTKTFLPRLVGAVGDASGNEDVTNVFYRWGRDNANEVEYLGETGASLFNLDYGIDPTITPYATFNNLVQLFTGASCSPGPPFGQVCTGGAVDLTTFFPGQTAIAQNTGYPDNENNVHTIEKLDYKRQFSPASFGNLTLFRTIESDIFLFPWDGGAFGDQFEHNVNNNLGVSFDYTNQLSSEHELSLGAETIQTTSKYDLGQPSFAVFVFSAVDPNTGLLPQTTGLVNDQLHRSNAWIQDRFSPTSRWTVQPGLRWDQEVLDIPSNAESQNLSLANTLSGTTIEVAGPRITSDVTRPSQVSPRFAASYQAGDNDVFRLSYGKNIEFTPFSNIEFKWNGDPGLLNIPQAPIPGFSPTCRNGIDPAHGNAPCNGITNLYQLFQDEYNTAYFAQYTPVRPQRATNVDVTWEHSLRNSFELKITPYYRKGVDYVVANTPLLFTLPDGTPIFGSPREENAGFNKSTGVEFIVQRLANLGWSGFVDATYDNTLENYNSDFFPAVNNAALALGHVFHASYLAPVTANMNLTYNGHGWHISNELPFESGYWYGVGTHTFVFENACIPGAPAIPVEVPNTDLAASCLGLNANTSAYYFTDPTNPGTVLNPHITGSRGTPDGTDPGTIRGPAVITWNLSISHDVGEGINPLQVGLRVNNVIGNYTDAVVGGNSRYRNNGLGGYNGAPGFFQPVVSGTNLVNPLYEPYQYPRGALPFENEPTGAARTYTFFVTEKF